MGNLNCKKNKKSKQIFINSTNKNNLSQSQKTEINTYKNIYYNIVQIKLTSKFILRKNSLLKLFEGNTYGLLDFNQKPFQLIRIKKDKKISMSQSWYSINKKYIVQINN